MKAKYRSDFKLVVIAQSQGDNRQKSRMPSHKRGSPPQMSILRISLCVCAIALSHSCAVYKAGTRSMPASVIQQPLQEVMLQA